MSGAVAFRAEPQDSAARPTWLGRLFGRRADPPVADADEIAAAEEGGPGILSVRGLRKSYGARTVVHEAGSRA